MPYNKLNPDNTVLTTLTIPLKEIGKGVKGTIDNIKVTTEAVDLSKLLANYNIALNAETSVSGLEVNDGRFTSSLAVDGNDNTRLSFARDKDEQWLLIDLGSVNTVSRIEINFFEHVSAYEIYLSEDGKNFTKVYEISGAVEKVKQIDTITLEKSQNARYVKYVQLKRWYMPDWNTYYSGGITEFRVFSFNESAYRNLIEEAMNFLRESDKSDPRRSNVRKWTTELENYINQDNIFITNAEYMFDQLTEALAPIPEPDISETVSDTVSDVSADASENETDTDTDGDSNSSVWPIIGAIAAGVAIVAAIAFIFKKKRKK
jgi:LPXTG-motif cell wall-anchored protein